MDQFTQYARHRANQQRIALAEAKKSSPNGNHASNGKPKVESFLPARYRDGTAYKPKISDFSPVQPQGLRAEKSSGRTDLRLVKGLDRDISPFRAAYFVTKQFREMDGTLDSKKGRVFLDLSSLSFSKVGIINKGEYITQFEEHLGNKYASRMIYHGITRRDISSHLGEDGNHTFEGSPVPRCIKLRSAKY